MSLPREKFGTSLSPNRLAYATADWPRPPCVRAASPHHRKLGAGYAALPQWLDGVSDVILDPLWRSRTTGIQNDRRLPGTTGPRVRSPWPAAFEWGVDVNDGPNPQLFDDGYFGGCPGYRHYDGKVGNNSVFL